MGGGVEWEGEGGVIGVRRRRAVGVPVRACRSKAVVAHAHKQQGGETPGACVLLFFPALQRCRCVCACKSSGAV